jgi:hypothetical protein
MRQLITLLKYGAGATFGLSLFIAALTPGVGEGQELTCLAGPPGTIVETCPLGDEKCVRIKVGEPSVLSKKDNKEIAFVLRDVIDTKIPPLVKALKDLKKEAETCESNCDFSPKNLPSRCEQPSTCMPMCTYEPLTPECMARIEPIKKRILKAMEDLKPFIDRFDAAQSGSIAHVLQTALRDVESCVLANDKIPTSCGDLVDPDLPPQDQVRVIPEGSTVPLRKGLCPAKDWTNIFCISQTPTP